MTDLIELSTPRVGPRMNGNSQYTVIPPKGKKPVGYTRSTTIAKTIDDGQGLIDWGKRMVAIGLATRPDLLSTAALHIDDTAESKKALNDVCSKALEAGGGTVRRDQGTAIHKMMELAHTDPTYTVPELHRAEVDAINDCLSRHGLEVVPEFSEMLCVLDDQRIAGRPDVVVRDVATGQLYIADLKTGATLLGAMAWSVQFTIAAHADARYIQGQSDDGSDDERLEMPAVSRETAIILHVEPGGTVCNAHDLDIRRGYEGLELAIAVRKFRSAAKAKKSPIIVERTVVGGGGTGTALSEVASTPSTDTGEAADREAAGVPPTLDSSPVSASDEPVHIATAAELTLAAIIHAQRVTWALERIEVIKAHDKAKVTLSTSWPPGVPTPPAIRDGSAEWTPEQLDAVVTALDAVEGMHQMPFGQEDPAVAAARAQESDERAAERAVKLDPPTLPEVDEGDELADDAEVLWLRSTLLGMLEDTATAPLVHTLIGWSKDGERQRRPWSMGDPAKGTTTPARRYAISLAAYTCLDLVDVEHDTPDWAVRHALAIVIGDDAMQPTFTVGGLLGSLDIDQARRLADVAATHRAVIDGDGTPRLTAAA